MDNKPCPCGAKANYLDCCGQYIDGTAIPATPQALMRSRYTAYTQANVDYIGATMQGPAMLNFEPANAKAWAERVHWQSLSVLRHEQMSPTEAMVEFVARFQECGTDQQIHEKSLFHKINKRWYYTDQLL